jgi:hypothetical protein
MPNAPHRDSPRIILRHQYVEQKENPRRRLSQSPARVEAKQAKSTN